MLFRSNAAANNEGTYTLIVTNATGCTATASVTVIVSPLPILVITNPAAVSPPSTVDLTLAAVTIGSTLPSGTVLTYYSDVDVTVVVANPAAITIAGTYYIKATTLSGCVDIKPVVVIINTCASALVLVSPTDDYSTGTQTKQASTTISATSKVTGSANVLYKAGNSVTLNPGFKADSGTVFRAEIGGCN